MTESPYDRIVCGSPPEGEHIHGEHELTIFSGDVVCTVEVDESQVVNPLDVDGGHWKINDALDHDRSCRTVLFVAWRRMLQDALDDDSDRILKAQRDEARLCDE